MKNYVNLVFYGDWTFYDINSLGGKVTIKPKKFKATKNGCIKMTCKLIDADEPKIKIVLTVHEFLLLFGEYDKVKNQIFTIDFDIVVHDGKEPDTIINYIEKKA